MLRRAALALAPGVSLLSIRASTGGPRAAPSATAPVEDIGPRLVLEVDVREPDGARALLDGGNFGSPPEAMLVLQVITREGICAFTDPSDPGLAATRYPPARFLAHPRDRGLVLNPAW